MISNAFCFRIATPLHDYGTNTRTIEIVDTYQNK